MQDRQRPQERTNTQSPLYYKRSIWIFTDQLLVIKITNNQSTVWRLNQEEWKPDRSIFFYLTIFITFYSTILLTGERRNPKHLIINWSLLTFEVHWDPSWQYFEVCEVLKPRCQQSISINVSSSKIILFPLCCKNAEKDLWLIGESLRLSQSILWVTH